MNIKKLVIERLVSQHGWAGDRLLDNVVTREYPTAVGLKQATVRIAEGNAQYWLKGEYQSEGRNALACCISSIKVSASVAEVEARVDAFVVDANKTVAETYAARLLRVA